MDTVDDESAGNDGDIRLYLVMKNGLESDEEARESLHEYMQSRLNHLEQPKDLRFGAALPVNERGKPADW